MVTSVSATFVLCSLLWSKGEKNVNLITVGFLSVLIQFIELRELAVPTRKNLVFAVRDLVQSYPNLLDPWTPHIYHLLDDPDISKDLLTIQIGLDSSHSINSSTQSVF